MLGKSNINELLKKLPDKKGRYVVIDTETTGLDLTKDYLINISAIEIINGIITGIQFNGYLRSREYKNGKNKNDIIKNKFYYIEEYIHSKVIPEKLTLQNFLNFIGDSIIFAHNSRFDEKFINRDLRKWDFPEIPQDRFRCSLLIARNLLKNEIKDIHRKSNLELICKHFKFNFIKNDFHHGMFDAFMCARIVCNFFDIIEEEKILPLEGEQKNNLNETNTDNSDIFDSDFDIETCSDNGIDCDYHYININEISTNKKAKELNTNLSNEFNDEDVLFYNQKDNNPEVDFENLIKDFNKINVESDLDKYSNSQNNNKNIIEQNIQNKINKNNKIKYLMKNYANSNKNYI